MANIKSIGGNPIVLGLDGLSDEVTHGYNPSLSVGRADALTGADETAQWATRESTGSGAATVRSVQGAAVGWNQLSPDARFTADVSGISVVSKNGAITISGTNTSDTTRYIGASNRTFSLTNGHKYLLRGGISESTQAPRIAVDSGGALPNGIYTTTGIITTCTADKADPRNLLVVEAGYEFAEPITCYPQLFDLTTMFGSGNEPATVAEFESMFPASYYPYSAPTLKPVQIAGIASTDAQGNALDSVEWDISAYFPDGMWSSGPYNDALFADHAEKKIGVGTITSHGAVTTGAIAKYCSLAGTGVDSYPSSFSLGDKADTISSLLGPCVHFSGSPTGLTVLRTWNGMYAYAPLSADDSVFDALVGTQVAYLKANTTTTPISPALPMTYRVQAGGSEFIIVPAGEVSAAPVLTVAEGESAADVVMDALACIAAPDGPVATSNHAINTYLTMQGKLYKVTSAIAVGETIAAGTNVTATTVMAEILALN